MWKKRLVSCVLAMSMMAYSVPSFAQSNEQANIPAVISSSEAGFELSDELSSIESRKVVEQETGVNKPAPLQNYVLGLKSEKGQIAASSEAEKDLGRTMNGSVDGDTTTRWTSTADVSAEKPEWIAFDLGQAKEINQITINWENAAKAYTIQTSDNPEGVALDAISDWKEVYTQTDGKKGVHNIFLDTPMNARYIRIHSTQSSNAGWASVSIWEMQVSNKPELYDVETAAAEINQAVPRYPVKDFELPLTINDNATVTWVSNNSAINIDNATGEATVTVPSTGNAEGTIIATVVLDGKTKEVTFQTKVSSVSNQLTEYKIYPVPQKVTRDGGKVQLTKEINVVADSSVNQNTKDRAKEILQANGHTVTFADAVSTTNSNLVLKVYAEGDENIYNIPVDALSKVEGDGAKGEWNVYDAHVVKLSENAQTMGDILVNGKHDDAVYYGLATVEQILEQGGDTLTSVTIEDFSNSKYRGIIEGFYGFAYTEEGIESLLDFGKRYKMNTFIYGPKADPYHLGLWREEYPDTITEEQRKNGMLTKDDIRKITQVAEKNNVDFVWSVHPMMEGGIDITTTAGVDKGIKDVLHKYELMYDLGVRHFAMFVDDISPSLAINNSENQAKLIGDVTAAFKAAHPEDFKPIFYVPTLYSLDVGNDAEKAKNHGEIAKLKNINDIIFTFTGNGVWSDIENTEMVKMSNLLKNTQKPTFWWNSAVNDNMDPFMFIGPTDMRYKMENNVTDTRGIMTNPMSQAEASKISIFGVLDYSWNVAEFDSMQNWEDSIYAIFADNEELAKQFKVFANHATPNGYIGTKSDKNYSGVEDIIANLTKTGGDTPENWNALKSNMQELKDATTYLKNNLKDNSNKYYAQMFTDLEPWINKLYTIADICIRSADINLGNITDITTYYNISYDYSRMSVDPEYNIVSLEGAGTEVYEVNNNATAGGSVLVKYLPVLLDVTKEKIKDKLPEASPRIIPTLIGSDITGLQLSEEFKDGFTISGLSGKTLQSNEFIGLIMPDITTLENPEELKASIPEGLLLQYSTNGKSWNVYSDDVKEENMSSFRIFNITKNPIVFTNDAITINVHTTKSSPALKAESNRGIYDGNIKNIYDGDWTTFAHFSGNQNTGQTFKVEYEEPFFMKSLQYVFTHDMLMGISAIEASLDGKTWTPIAKLNGSDGFKPEYKKIDDVNYQIYNITDINVKTKYVRLTITEKATNPDGSVPYHPWLKCHEVIPNGGGNSAPLATAINGSGATNILDNNPKSVFFPIHDKEDILSYTIPAPEKVDSIEVYMNTEKDLPKAEAKVRNEWQEVSMVHSTEMPYLYTIDVSALSNFSAIRLNWTNSNVPKVLYDINYRTGTDTTVWPSNSALFDKYSEALSANKADYSDKAWVALKAAMRSAAYIISSQSTETEINDAVLALDSAIIQHSFDVEYGDVNENKTIDAADASIILQHIQDPLNNPLSSSQEESAKVSDGKIITANDASMILQKVIDPNFIFPIARIKLLANSIEVEADSEVVTEANAA